MLFITNKMPNFAGAGTVSLSPVDPRKVIEQLQTGFISLIDDETTAKCLTTMLGATVPTGTINISPKIGEDTVVLVNMIGELPKGTVTLPVNVLIQFSVIESNKPMVDTRQIKKGIAEWLLKGL